MIKVIMAVLLLLLTSTATFVRTPTITAQEIQAIEYLDLPSDSLPMGILYDSDRNIVWVALQWNRSIAKIDVATRNITIYQFPWDVTEDYKGRPLPWTLTLDPNGDLWILIEDYMVTPNKPPEKVPYLAKFDVETETLTLYDIPLSIQPGRGDIKYYNGYLWYLTKGALNKVNYTTGEIIQSYYIDVACGYIAIDYDCNCLWLTSVLFGKVFRFNITSETFDIEISGLDRPLGIEVDKNNVYVAENSNNVGSRGTIAVINKSTLEISRIQTATITNQGPYHILKDMYGNLWWTDGSYHIGVIGNKSLAIPDLTYDSKPYCYFMAEVPGNSIWFSCVGSAHVGIVHSPKSTDVNNDKIVDMRDIGYVCSKYFAVEGDNRYSSDADIDSNGIIDMRDIGCVCKFYMSASST